MLGPIVETAWSHERGDGVDLALVREMLNRDGQYVTTFAASVKEWCREWRVYTMAFDSRWPSEEGRRDECLRVGVKLPEEVARAIFPEIERQYAVTYRP